MGVIKIIDSQTSTFNCQKCGGKGLIPVEIDGYMMYEICDCHKAIHAERMIKKSGLADTLDQFTFDAYVTDTDWRTEAKAKAQAFLDDHNGKWFYIGGQPGAGKTHLCTAIVGEMLKRGIPARYMRWRDAMDLLRAIRFDEWGYRKQMDKWKYTEVLYIDDLFKSPDLDTFERNVTFSILDARWAQATSITILSSEYTVAEICKMDEAVGGRIMQRAKDYGVKIPRDVKSDWRLYGV